jgi:hypothetical protein
MWKFEASSFSILWPNLQKYYPEIMIYYNEWKDSNGDESLNSKYIQQMRRDNRGSYTLAGIMPWMNKNSAVNEKSFAIAVMKV